MSETLTFTIDEVTPPRAAVFENQGIPAETVVRDGVDALYEKALALFAETADCTGVLAEISQADFEAVYQGQGGNEPETPVADILGRAEHLALFAVTLGARISQKIDELFESNDYPLGCMLDSAASAGADRMAEVAQSRFRDMLLTRGSPASVSVVLGYSPGYCGWHVSGQRRLFEFLRPERIGITLRESFLMEPLKSVSGVLIAGPREIHDFPPAYTFCSECETLGCRERMRALVAE
ncbi:MAG: vitamin B12 dependent-methionine synthase activation domain-containing protein [Planctomycetota bacterium]|jgi:hypothetical protein